MNQYHIEYKVGNWSEQVFSVAARNADSAISKMGKALKRQLGLAAQKVVIIHVKVVGYY